MKSLKAAKGVHLWLLLWKAARAVEVHARHSVETLEIGLSEFGVLEALLHKGPLPVNVLGKKVLLTSGSATAAVDRLESRKLVVRKLDKNDRRARIVQLTPKGAALIRKSFARHERDMERAVSFLSATEIESLAAALRKLGRGVENGIHRSKKQGR